MTAIAGDFICRNAPLEYWFVKLQAGELSCVIDFIFRAGADSAEVRISMWVRRKGCVLHSARVPGQTRGTEVSIGGNMFTGNRSTGRIRDVEWDLRWATGPVRIAPSFPLLSGLHPLDLELISYPRAGIAGQVRVSEEVFPVLDTSGTVTHYWGRRLPDEWRWVSGHGPENNGTAVEAVLMKSRLWGRTPALRAGYLWIAEDGPGAGSLLVSPVSGMLTAAGHGKDFIMTGRGLRRTVQLHCSAAPEDFNDLGEGIRQTLQGKCAFAGDIASLTDAGLEYRGVT